MCIRDSTYTVVLDWDNQYNDLVLAKSIIDHTQDGDVVYDYSIINVGNANACLLYTSRCV